MGSRPLRDDATLIVDYTGVGRGVVDQMYYAGLSPVAVQIHGGDSVTADANGFRVPKRELVTAVQIAFTDGTAGDSGRPARSGRARQGTAELSVKLNLRSGHDSYEAWREKDHDDLVLAAALAVWYRDYMLIHWDTGAAAALTRFNRQAMRGGRRANTDPETTRV